MFTGLYRECMLLFLRLIQERETRRRTQMTRAQIAEVTLKKLWGRERLTADFLEDVQEWLLTAGWTSSMPVQFTARSKLKP